MEIDWSDSKCASSVLTTSFWLVLLFCQGVTFRIENGELVIARILHGGMIDQQGLLHVGDIIKEVNGRDVGDDARVLQEMLQEASGSVVLKILPSYQEPHPPRQVPCKYTTGHVQCTCMRRASVTPFTPGIMSQATSGLERLVAPRMHIIAIYFPLVFLCCSFMVVMDTRVRSEHSSLTLS